MSAKIEKLVSFPDGNWVAYGSAGEDGKRVELARGKGIIPYSVGDEINSNASKTEAKAGPKFTAKAERINPIVMEARHRALGCAVAYCSNPIKDVNYLDFLLWVSAQFEKWLLRQE